eukprot:1709872-Amphidinium_carterae.1
MRSARVSSLTMFLTAHRSPWHASTALPRCYEETQHVHSIVARAGDAFPVVPFSKRYWSGVCSQDMYTSWSSTLVRLWMAEGVIPAIYGPEGSRALQDLWPCRLRIERIQLPDGREKKKEAYKHGLAEPWSAQAQAATYGAGYSLLARMGYDGGGHPPVIGVARPRRIGVLDDESQAVDHKAMQFLDVPPPASIGVVVGDLDQREAAASHADQVEHKHKRATRTPAQHSDALPKAMPKKK